MSASAIPAPTIAAPARDTKVLGRRMVAGLIDVIVVGAITVGIAALQHGVKSSGGSFHFSVHGVGALAAFAAFVLYYSILESTTGKTLGKALTGIRVVIKGDGNLSFGKALIRTLLRIVDVLPVLYLVGIITIAVSSTDQRIGDMAAGTQVAKG